MRHLPYPLLGLFLALSSTGAALAGGRPGETWSAEPAADRLRVVRD
ncbi:TPA: hypothetical protein NO321_002103 [Pseudomonas aeruginosa]|nr:hypothetical protein [Pseudomonas aeruginosa]HBO5752776.1 hypothetical protein [Pseudomonas aeruginosa]HBO5932268.1 hypothetical protein [Pseudomonas aeruginosa]HBO6039002.1 hypothetical protein [Pseudomonas aeruginosa]HBO6217448.1 hypothetical protein [Pseudomonas aeruginosa]